MIRFGLGTELLIGRVFFDGTLMALLGGLIRLPPNSLYTNDIGKSDGRFDSAPPSLRNPIYPYWVRAGSPVACNGLSGVKSDGMLTDRT